MSSDHVVNVTEVNESNINAAQPASMTSESKESSPLPREHLISTAVKFLQSSAVVNSSLKDKKEFLSKKGLTDIEITEALDRAQTLIDTNHQQVLVPSSSGSRFRSWSVFLALFGGALYGCYKLYKNYVIPFLTEEESDTDTLNTRLAENTQALSAFGERIDQLQQSCERNSQKIDQLQTSSRSSNSGELKELKDELSSLKKLLLSRHQFPETPSVKPVIPAWQLEAAKETEVVSVPETISTNSDSPDSAEGGDSIPLQSSTSAGGTQSIPDHQLGQNGVSDSDTESMADTEQSVTVNGSSTEPIIDNTSPVKLVESGNLDDQLSHSFHQHMHPNNHRNLQPHHATNHRQLPPHPSTNHRQLPPHLSTNHRQISPHLSSSHSINSSNHTSTHQLTANSFISSSPQRDSQPIFLANHCTDSLAHINRYSYVSSTHCTNSSNHRDPQVCLPTNHYTTSLYQCHVDSSATHSSQFSTSQNMDSMEMSMHGALPMASAPSQSSSHDLDQYLGSHSAYYSSNYFISHTPQPHYSAYPRYRPWLRFHQRFHDPLSSIYNSPATPSTLSQRRFNFESVTLPTSPATATHRLEQTLSNATTATHNTMFDVAHSDFVYSPHDDALDLTGNMHSPRLVNAESTVTAPLFKQLKTYTSVNQQLHQPNCNISTRSIGTSTFYTSLLNSLVATRLPSLSIFKEAPCSIQLLDKSIGTHCVQDNAGKWLTDAMKNGTSDKCVQSPAVSLVSKCIGVELNDTLQNAYSPIQFCSEQDSVFEEHRSVEIQVSMEVTPFHDKYLKLQSSPMSAQASFQIQTVNLYQLMDAVHFDQFNESCESMSAVHFLLAMEHLHATDDLVEVCCARQLVTHKDFSQNIWQVDLRNISSQTDKLTSSIIYRTLVSEFYGSLENCCGYYPQQQYSVMPTLHEIFCEFTALSVQNIYYKARDTADFESLVYFYNPLVCDEYTVPLNSASLLNKTLLHNPSINIAMWSMVDPQLVSPLLICSNPKAVLQEITWGTQETQTVIFNETDEKLPNNIMTVQSPILNKCVQTEHEAEIEQNTASEIYYDALDESLVRHQSTSTCGDRLTVNVSIQTLQQWETSEKITQVLDTLNVCMSTQTKIVQHQDVCTSHLVNTCEASTQTYGSNFISVVSQTGASDDYDLASDRLDDAQQLPTSQPSDKFIQTTLSDSSSTAQQTNCICFITRQIQTAHVETAAHDTLASSSCTQTSELQPIGSSFFRSRADQTKCLISRDTVVQTLNLPMNTQASLTHCEDFDDSHISQHRFAQTESVSLIDQLTQTIEVVSISTEPVASNKSQYYMALETGCQFCDSTSQTDEVIAYGDGFNFGRDTQQTNSYSAIDSALMMDILPLVSENLHPIPGSREVDVATSTQSITKLLQSVDSQKQDNVDVCTQIESVITVTRSSGFNTDAQNELDSSGCQTMIHIPVQRIKATENITSAFFANVHGVSKSTFTIYKSFANIAVGAYIPTRNEGTSTSSSQTSNKSTYMEMLQVVQVIQTEKINNHDIGTQSEHAIESPKPKMVDRAVQKVAMQPEMISKFTSDTDAKVDESADNLIASIQSFQENKSITIKNDTILSTLFSKFGQISTHVNVWKSTSDSAIWNKNIFPSASINASNSSVVGNSKNMLNSTCQLFQSALELMITDQGTQTDELTNADQNEQKDSKEMDFGLAWEILESVANVGDNDAPSSINPKSLLQVIKEESEGELVGVKPISTQPSNSSTPFIISTNFTPSGSKSGQMINEAGRLTDQAVKSYSEGHINITNLQTPQKSFVLGPSKNKEDLSYVSSELSDFPTIKANDFNIRKLKSGAPPSAHPDGDQVDSQHDELQNCMFMSDNISAKHTEGMATSKAYDENSTTESLSLSESSGIDASSSCNTLSDLTDLLASTNSMLTSVTTDTLDAVLSQSFSELLKSDTDSTIT